MRPSPLINPAEAAVRQACTQVLSVGAGEGRTEGRATKCTRGATRDRCDEDSARVRARGGPLIVSCNRLLLSTADAHDDHDGTYPANRPLDLH